MVSYHRWFAEWGVRLPSEKSQRKLRDEWTPDCLETEMALFSFIHDKTQELRPAPYVFIPTLWPQISSMLDNLER